MQTVEAKDDRYTLWEGLPKPDLAQDTADKTHTKTQDCFGAWHTPIMDHIPAGELGIQEALGYDPKTLEEGVEPC